MNNKEKDIELIEQYIDKVLEGKDLSDFEERLQNEEEFAKLYNFRIKVAANWNKADEYKNVKEEVKESLQNKTIKPKFKLNRYWAAAIVTVLVLIPSAVIVNRVNNNRQADSEVFELQMNDPSFENAANYYDASFEQIIPEDKHIFSESEEVSFEWNSSLNVRTAIIIRDAKNNSMVYRFPIKSNIKEYQLRVDLEPGDYLWELEGFDGEQTFSVN